MRILLLILIFIPSISFGQNSIDYNFVSKAILNQDYISDTSKTDIKVLKLLEAFDNHFYDIVGTYKSPAYKYTIIRNSLIKVRQLLNKEQTLNLITNDSSHFLKYNKLWKESEHDTAKFLNWVTVQSDFELYYPNFQSPQEISIANPLSISKKIKFKNILFYSDHLNFIIDSLAKKFNAKQKINFAKYLETNFDTYDIETNRLNSQAIRILNITFSNSNFIYAGVDIYGSHYLLTFKMNDNWDFVSKKKLWVY